MTPMNRKEVFLKAVADGSASPIEPMTREELWLDAIIKAIAEGGSGGGVLVVHMDENRTLDKTWSEIDAVDVAVIVLRRSEDGATEHLRELVTDTTGSDGEYYVEAGDHLTFQTNTADGYPTLQQ